MSVLTWAMILIYAIAVLRTAWLSDDAYITFRVVDNAVHGLGLVWNSAERVQGYTHPLWLFALIVGRLITGESYYSAIWLSIAISVVAVGLIILRLRPVSAFVVPGLLILALSKAFVDYSTSGLENPLTHLLLAAFLVVWFAGYPTDQPPDDKQVFFLSLLAALLAINRIDALLLVLPVLLWVIWWRRTWRALGLIVLGFLPLILWTVFSLFYYGFPFPNTAYAKLATGIASADLSRQGVAYLMNSLRWDPLTLIAVSAALILAAASRWARTLAVAVGIALYLLYIIQIGGDFMSGRFLAAPLLAAVVLLIVLGDQYVRNRATGKGTIPAVAGRFTVAATVFIVAFGLVGHVQYRLAGNPVGDAARRDGDIADERAYYTPNTGLLYPNRDLHPWAEQGMVLRAQGPAVVEHGNVGFLGYYAGPDVHIVDRNGLTDPLLARLPVRDPVDWRIGHFRREVPAGYIDTLRDGRNLIQDPDLAAYYEPLRFVTSGRLWSTARWFEIWRFNTGAYDDLLPSVWPRPLATPQLATP
ncbi:MAG: hypothetical protein KBF17_10730 [Candidatus Promineofilum sp.]|nr:hypothetical protein [Promineifilum sp.]